jgi:hypothetical protein
VAGTVNGAFFAHQWPAVAGNVWGIEADDATVVFACSVACWAFSDDLAMFSAVAGWAFLLSGSGAGRTLGVLYLFGGAHCKG